MNGGGKVKSSGRKSAKIECRRPLPPSGLKGEVVGRDMSETLFKNPSKKKKKRKKVNKQQRYCLAALVYYLNEHNDVPHSRKQKADNKRSVKDVVMSIDKSRACKWTNVGATAHPLAVELGTPREL
jgi:hypothetical protein